MYWRSNVLMNESIHSRISKHRIGAAVDSEQADTTISRVHAHCCALSPPQTVALSPSYKPVCCLLVSAVSRSIDPVGDCC